MKKLLALVLALIMVLGLGVTAFAADTIKVIKLGEETEDDDDLETLTLLPTAQAGDLKGDDKKVETVYLVSPKGDDYYVEIADYANLKNVTVSATGNVTAEIVEFDPDTMRYPTGDYYYRVVDSIKETETTKNDTNGYIATGSNGLETTLAELNNATSKTVTVDVTGLDIEDYDYQKAYADAFNKLTRRGRFSVCVFYKDAEGKMVKADKHLLKITVGENYSAAYKEGSVKITAKLGKDTVVANLTIISDVSIFEFEEVNWAAEEDEYLYVTDKGYSDYMTAKTGYGIKYDADKIRVYDYATVVSTTAFRAIEGEELTVAADDDNYVTIDEIAKGQKGVNFAFEDYKYYDEDDEKLATGKLDTADELKAVKGNLEYVTFGFLGNQVINSDFTIYVNPHVSYYQLRELFGKKVEEEDVITYYVLKDGKKIDEFTVDYANDDIDDEVELEILGKAGDKLGFYTLTLDAPAAEEGEENPNTGAESVVGVVAAMAVVSLVAAAAVSLKK